MRRAAVVVLVGVLVAGCSGGGSPAVPTPAAPERTQALPVYFAATTAAGMRLQREFHTVTTADPASDAVRQMLGPPIDPDYRTLWPSGTSLRSPVTIDGGAIVVDLTGTPAPTGMALQELVFTVEGALQSALPVQLTIDGAPVGGSVPRGDDYAVRSLVQIDSPADGAPVGREVVVRGEACVFEATLPWEVRRDGAVVKSGVTSTAEGQRFSAYSFTVALEPGTYEVRVTEDDPSGGEGRPVMSDTKTVTVG
jgi:Immunoglobulin-like domain of bacterial spore germination/Sporulation and spore germination